MDAKDPPSYALGSKAPVVSGAPAFSGAPAVPGIVSARTSPALSRPSAPSAASIGLGASSALRDALRESDGSVDGARSIDEAREMEADIAALEKTYQALKTEFSRRLAPAEFQQRIAALGGELRVLSQRRTQLTLLMDSPTLRVVAPPAARAQDHSTIKDRK